MVEVVGPAAVVEAAAAAVAVAVVQIVVALLAEQRLENRNQRRVRDPSCFTSSWISKSKSTGQQHGPFIEHNTPVAWSNQVQS